MKAYLASLNPVERRFVIIVGLLLFVVINIFLVWPHFSDWGNLKMRLEEARLQLKTNQTAILQTNALAAQIKKLGSEDSAVPLEDQAGEFFRIIQNQVNASGVGFKGNSRPIMRTNQYFIEQEQPITIEGGEKQIVDFLYKLGAGTSLIRVKSLSVRPADPNRYQLRADMTLVASYQKKAPSRPAPAAKPPVSTTSTRSNAAAQKTPTPPKRK